MGVQSYEKKMRTAKKKGKNVKEKNKKRQPDHEDLIAQNTHIIIEKYLTFPVLQG